MLGSDAEKAARQYYRRNAADLLFRYEKRTFEEIHSDLLPHLPDNPGLALDVGAGSGRDAAWLARHGWLVSAVEPSALLRNGGKKLHPSTRIRWINDRLPFLPATVALNLTFDLILASAVWMHLSSLAQVDAVSTLASMAKPNGLLNITYRNVAGELHRGFQQVNGDELVSLAWQYGFRLLARTTTPDAFARSTVEWHSYIMRKV